MFPKYQTLSKSEIDVHTLYSFQEKAHVTKGNLILQAPTGSGKTLAAQLWAGKNQKRNGRLFYCLPNTASINAMYLRLCKYYGETKMLVSYIRGHYLHYILWAKTTNLIHL